PQGARVWISNPLEVWRVAEITRGYREGDAVLHLRLEGGSVRLELCSPVGPSSPAASSLQPQLPSGASDPVAVSHLHEPAVLHS
ncbi:MYO5B protein, partial [Aphelocoma coerulescens]|nr:MYO5B protein [Aphelocoma coerulescens]